ncbi:hybrid sensor histidine kinase/response regulator [Roseimaritima ulvae]|uniref:histidine kinase n=1 Tax=Roseimaritima ulvae TaxID=980254 RepID=A0A5B9QPJ4_9BACT|nr:hybrid sensor histidine kinase/response regulator [Roseimaritima ulvae]QEG40938.1 Aerobic respiration control sensor protein ArcB [Roseimaritima ulvae]
METIRKSLAKRIDACTQADGDRFNQRVVAWTPTPQDSRLCDQILQQNGIAVICCETLKEFLERITEGAGIALVAQEHLGDAIVGQIRHLQSQQPKWSELPILVLLQPGEVGSATLQRILSMDHVTLVNRPLRIAVFVNTVLAKLRDRLRQYEVRDLLLEKDVAQQNLVREASRLDMAMRAGGMAAWEWSKTKMYWSRSLREIHGFEADVEPSESALFASIIEGDRQRIVSQWAEAIERSEAIRSEFRIDHPQLGERWIAAVAEPVRSKSGKTIRYAGLQWDVTDRKTSELALRQSHETMQRLINDNPQGLYVIDDQMRMLYFSKGSRKVFAGIDPLIGRPFDEVMRYIWPEEFAAQAVALFRHTLETGEPYTAPTLVETRVDLNVQEAYDWSIERIALPGNRYGVVCHFTDTTQRQQSLENLRQSEKHFREIADASPAMLWVTDVNHMCTFLSKSWYKTTGQTEEQGLELGWTNAAHPDDRSRAADEFLAAAKARQPFSSEFRLRQADGGYRWAVDVGLPRYDADGTFLGYTGYVIDVHDRKQFEQSLERAKLLAEAANQSRGEFLANMSHEIRTPMAAIIGHADILNDHLQDPDNRQVVDTIRRNGQFLLDIINDILDLSKIDAGKMQIDRKPVRPDAVVAEVRSLMDVRAAEKSLPLNIEFAGPVPEHLNTDAIRLRQILVNLVGNAIKFTDRGEVRMVVRYEAEESDDTGWLHFEVIDTGIGIPAASLNTLFDPFVQVDNTSTRSFGGTGLGLAICQRLATALDGDIAVASELGRGSRFTLSIRAKQPGRLVEPNLTVDTTVAEPAEQIRLSATVLVVDDRRDIRYLAQHFIERSGGNVITATNGQEALDIIAASSTPPIDLIVMDMQMPVMDGYVATAELRRRNCQLPIIALTANAMKSDRDECLAAGCTDYQTKPLNSTELIAMIDRLVRASAKENAW